MRPISGTPAQEKKTPTCHVGTPTPSQRRAAGVKPLGESNRSRSHSPALGSLSSSVKDKRTHHLPATPAKKTMLTGVDLTRRFNDSVCSSRSPRVSPLLDRIHEGSSSSLRKGPATTVKSRLRGGGDDTPPVKKAITFSTPRETSLRKQENRVKRRDLSEQFAPKENRDVDFIGHSKLAQFSDRLRGKLNDIRNSMASGVGYRSFGASEGNSFVKDVPCRLAFDWAGLSPPPAQDTNTSLGRYEFPSLSPAENANDLTPSPLSCKSDMTPSPLSCRSNVTPSPLSCKSDMTPSPLSSRSNVTPSPLSYKRDVTPSPLPCKEDESDVTHSPLKCQNNASDLMRSPSKDDESSVNFSPPKSEDDESFSPLKGEDDERFSPLKGEDNESFSPFKGRDDEGFSPLPCQSPEVCNGGFAMDDGDSVAHEWFRSREISCFESFNKVSKTPEAQPSKSPELSKRALTEVGVAANPQQQQTPSPQPTSSPEFLKRGSVPPSSNNGCFGAGTLMVPEGVRSVKDRRKCKPRGILTIEAEYLFSSGSADFAEEAEPEETISVPALASVEWMVANGYEVEPASSEKADSSLKFTPDSFRESASTGSMPGHRRCRSAIESGGSEQVFWKKGLLYEWNLSLSDQKRADSAATTTPSSVAEDDEEDDQSIVSPIGKLQLCEFSPEYTPRLY